MNRVDPNDVTCEIRIAARPETIFPFLIDPAKMTRWIGISADLDPRPGGVYHVIITRNDIARGEYVVIEPYHRVVFTFGWEAQDHPVPPGSSTVEINLEPDGAETIVRLRHSGLPTGAGAGHAEGWNQFLPGLLLAAEGQQRGVDASGA